MLGQGIDSLLGGTENDIHPGEGIHHLGWRTFVATRGASPAVALVGAFPLSLSLSLGAVFPGRAGTSWTSPAITGGAAGSRSAVVGGAAGSAV